MCIRDSPFGELELSHYSNFLHYGAHPAFDVLFSQAAGFGVSSDATDTGYNGAARSFDSFTLLGDTFELSVSGDPDITSQETTPAGTGLSFSSSGAVLTNVTGTNLQVPVTLSPHPSISFTHFVPTSQYSKDVIHTLSIGCSFELPSEMSLVPNRTNTQSINQRLGNMNSGNPLRSGQKNTNLDKGAFTSTITTPHLGDSIYLCSSLTSNAGLLPSGFPGAVARIPITNFDPMDDIWYQEGTYHNFVDVGGRTLTSLHFSLRDHSGNLIPLEEGYEWSAQLQFGFPEK